MLKNHRRNRDDHSNEIEKKRQAAIKALHHFNKIYLDRANRNVTKAYNNQRKLHRDVRKLKNESDRFMKISQLWMTDLNKFQEALKELGDLGSWSDVIEKDLNEIYQDLSGTNQKD